VAQAATSSFRQRLQRKLAHAAPQWCRVGGVLGAGILSAFRVACLGASVAQTVVWRRGGEVLTNIDALRRVACYRCQQGLEIEAIRRVRHSCASHLLDSRFA
jgi:hypothetical protein